MIFPELQHHLQYTQKKNSAHVFQHLKADGFSCINNT